MSKKLVDEAFDLNVKLENEFIRSVEEIPLTYYPGDYDVASLILHSERVGHALIQSLKRCQRRWKKYRDDNAF